MNLKLSYAPYLHRRNCSALRRTALCAKAGRRGSYGKGDATRGAATFEDVGGFGQPYGTQESRASLVDVRQRDHVVLYTPLGASWLNMMTESMQRILKRRALLEGHYPEKPEQIIEWLEEAARGWNRDPTPFEWGGGRRAARRKRTRQRRHSLGGSGACARQPIRRRHRKTAIEKWQRANQLTH